MEYTAEHTAPDITGNYDSRRRKTEIRRQNNKYYPTAKENHRDIRMMTERKKTGKYADVEYAIKAKQHGNTGQMSVSHCKKYGKRSKLKMESTDYGWQTQQLR